MGDPAKKSGFYDTVRDEMRLRNLPHEIKREKILLYICATISKR